MSLPEVGAGLAGKRLALPGVGGSWLTGRIEFQRAGRKFSDRGRLFPPVGMSLHRAGV